MHRSVFFFVTLVALASVAQADEPTPVQICHFGFECKAGECGLPRNDVPASVTYDLSKLTKNASSPLPTEYDYKFFAADGYNYFANVCANTRHSCDALGPHVGDAVRMNANETLSHTDCHVLGTTLDAFSLIDTNNVLAGVSVKYMQGDEEGCAPHQYRTVNMVFNCELIVGETEIVNVTQLGTCDFEIVFNSGFGCPASIIYHEKSDDKPDTGLSGGSTFLIVLFVLAFVYLVGGMALNKSNGKQGLELVPNYQFWIFTLPELVKEGCRYSAAYVRNLVQGGSGSGAGHSAPAAFKEYDEVQPTTDNSTNHS